MTKIEALELELAARKMVEGTELNWNAVIRHHPTKQNLATALDGYYPENVELALGIVEGKPVWKGDDLYYTDNGVKWRACNSAQICSAASWNPPKPKTVTIEMTVEDAEYWKWLGEMYKDNKSWSCKARYEEIVKTLSESCSKSLENLK